eukprot:762769-Hanusia_phi.AAC.6
MVRRNRSKGRRETGRAGEVVEKRSGRGGRVGVEGGRRRTGRRRTGRRDRGKDEKGLGRGQGGPKSTWSPERTYIGSSKFTLTAPNSLRSQDEAWTRGVRSGEEEERNRRGEETGRS